MSYTPNQPIKLLLVDDDPGMIRLLTMVIKRSLSEEVEMKSLTNPKEARAWIENEVVDVLVTDLEMPGISGLELLRCAKRANACTQVLFVTGNSTLDALTDALELGATDYLLKPLDQAELIEIVGQALKRRRRWQKALAHTLAARHGQAPVSAG